VNNLRDQCRGYAGEEPRVDGKKKDYNTKDRGQEEKKKGPLNQGGKGKDIVAGRGRGK